MRLRLLFACLFPLFFSIGCRTSRGGSAAELKDSAETSWSEVPELSCPGGEAAYFMLQDVPNAKWPDWKSRELPDARQSPYDFQLPPSQYPLVVVRTQYLHTRLDICMFGDRIELKRILRGPARRDLEIIDVGPDAVVKGLHETIFDGDSSKLDIVIPLGNFRTARVSGPMKSDEALLIRGSAKEPVAVAIHARKEGDQFRIHNDRELTQEPNNATVGTFEYFDLTPWDPAVGPPPSGSCEPEGTDAPPRVGIRAGGPMRLDSGEFTAGTAHFKWVSYGNSQWIDMSLGPKAVIQKVPYLDVCKFTVTDSAKELGDKAGVPVTVYVKGSPEEKEKFYSYTNTHHRYCDSQVFRTPHATYAFDTGNSRGKSCKNNRPPLLPPPGKRFRFTYGQKVVDGDFEE